MSITVIGGIFREVLNADSEPRPRMGGSGLTAAVMAARLGADVALVSYVGADDADIVNAMLDTAGVDRSNVQVVPGASGTFVFPTVEADGRPWPMYRPAEAIPERLPAAGSETTLVFGIPDYDAIAAGAVDVAVESLLVWDRQGFLSRSRDSRAAAQLAARRKLYLANLDEALEEFPAPNAADALQPFPPPGFSTAIVKRGADGCTVFAQERVEVAGFPVDSPVSIGSGDAFAGALVAGLQAGLVLVEAAQQANAAAAAFLETGDSLAEQLPDRIAELLQGA